MNDKTTKTPPCSNGTLDAMADKVDHAKDGVIDLAETVQDRATTMAKSIAKTATRAKDQATDLISDATAPVQKFVEDKYDDGKKAIQQFSHDATELIAKYPLTAVAIGLGLGLLVGRAAGGRA